MYAKKHRPMQKLTAICLSVTIAAASLLSGHVFASDEAPQTDYLTGQELLAELREMGLGQDVIPDELPPDASDSSETNTEDPSDTTGEPGDGDQTDSTEPGNPDEGGSGEGDPDPGESTPEQPGDGDQTGGTEPGNPDGNNPGEGGSGEGDTDTDTDPGTDNPDNSDPAASTDPDEGDGAEQGSNQNQPSAPAESTESASGEVPLVTHNDEMTVNDPQIPGETPAAPEEDNDKDPAPSDEQTPSEDPGDDGTTTTPGDDNTSQNPDENPGGETTTPPEEETGDNQVPSGGDEIDPGFGVDPSTPIEEIPETSGITEEQRAELEAYVQTLEAEQVVSLDGTDITVQEYEDLCSMLTAQQFYLIDLYLNPPKIPQNVTTPEGLVETPEPVRPFRLMSLMAARNDTEPVKTDGLVTSKTATMNEEGTEAAINLEAYVSGEVESGTESVPLDIVLVLDQSGSMEDVFESVTSAELVVEKWEGVFILGTSYWGAAATSTPLYYLPDGGNPNNPDDYLAVDVQVVDRTLLGIPYRVQLWCDLNQNGSYEENEMISDTPTGIFGVYTPYEGVDIPLYQKDWQVETETQIKLNALKESVQSFITSVEEDAVETGAQHRIAIVGFASEYGYGNNTEILSVEGHNTLITGTKEDYIGVAYDEITNNDYRNALQDVTDPDGQIMLDNATNSLAANGATRSDLGMKMAEEILDANPVGNSGRKQVVIMFTDGTPTTSNSFSSSVANDAVNYAKNMKDAGVTVYTIGIFDGAQPLTPAGDENNTEGNENKYMHAVSSNYPNAESYTNLGSSANTPPKTYYLSAGDANTLNKIFENIYHEIVTPSLELGSSAVLKDVVSDYFQLPEGFNASNVTVEVMEATGSGETPTWVKTDQTLSATVDEATKTVSVTGFDYSANAVVKNSNGEWKGKKLVVSFNVEPRDGFLGGNAVPTNDSESGVYDGNAVVENFDIPKVNVPINYIFSTKPQTIYLGNEADASAAVTLPQYIGADAWKDDYVTIGTPVWNVENPEAFAPDDCGNYDVVVTVKPNDEPVKEGPTNDMDGKVVEKEATVHVLKPTLNFKDTYEDGPTNGYRLTGNQKEDFITWSDFNSHTEIPAVSGDEPTITLNYTWMEKQEGNPFESTTVDLTETANFQVKTITIGDETYSDFAVDNPTDATVDYRITTDCSNATTEPALNDEHHEGRHFTIHLPSEFDLTIKKNVPADYVTGETFRFIVTGPDGYRAEFTLGEFSDGTDDWSVTLKDLKPGEYTITEDTGWSWRYKTVSAKCTAGNVDDTNSAENIFTGSFNDDATVTFTNQKTDNHWLSWEDTKVNIFKAS